VTVAGAAMDFLLRIPSVTGVDLELRVAGPGGRSFAFVIDWHIRVLASMAWYVLSLFLLMSPDETPLSVVGTMDSSFIYFVALPAVAIYALYHPVLEVLMKGRTPGKRIAGVRLVNRDGGVPGAGALLIRNVFRLIDGLPFAYCVGLITVMVTRHSLRIGDLAAGTLLVYDEPPPKAVLSELSGDALERLGLQHAEIVRDLLRRWPELEPEARDRLAKQLLDKLGVSRAGSDQELRRRLEALLT
jgi:uncharacterized RDD family membrane protein YckC